MNIKLLQLCVVVISMVGLVFVASSTAYQAAVSGGFDYLFVKQALALVAGIIAMCIVSKYMTVAVLEYLNFKFFIFTLGLLILTIVPGVGYSANGAARWLSFPGINFQPIELLKISFIIYISFAVAKNYNSLKDIVTIVVPPFIVIAAVLLKQPDFGSVVMLLVVLIAIIFVGSPKFKFRHLFVSATAVIAAAAFFVMSSPYRMKRVFAFLNPEDSPLDYGYQSLQSFKAISHGGLWGIGWGNSYAVRDFLPESHTDYIFSIIAEQMGLVFSSSLLLLLLAVPVVMLLSATRTASSSYDYTSRFMLNVVAGVSILWSLEVVINVGSVIGFIPPKGVGLPLLSYGGSSLVSHLVMVSIATCLIFVTGRGSSSAGDKNRGSP